MIHAPEYVKRSHKLFYMTHKTHILYSVDKLTELRGRVMIAEARVKRLERLNKELTDQIQKIILKEYIDAK